MALLLMALMAGCVANTGPADDGGVGIVGDGGAAVGTLEVGQPCVQNSDCKSVLCTQFSYDRKTTPVCTYTCDSADPNPLCPMGCNPKGYCRIQ